MYFLLFSKINPSFFNIIYPSLWDQIGKVIAGWWYEPYPSEKYELVSWEYEIPNIWKNMFQTTKQIESTFKNMSVIS